MSYQKYRASPTIVDGVRFASKAESRRYSELKCLERAGIISGLELQPEFAIAINGKHCFKYLADFAYQDGGVRVIEDVKSEGTKTDVYRIKKKCVEAAYGIKIQEIGIRQKTPKQREVSNDVKEIFREANRRRA